MEVGLVNRVTNIKSLIDQVLRARADSSIMLEMGESVYFKYGLGDMLTKYGHLFRPGDYVPIVDMLTRDGLYINSSGSGMVWRVPGDNKRGLAIKSYTGPNTMYSVLTELVIGVLITNKLAVATPNFMRIYDCVDATFKQSIIRDRNPQLNGSGGTSIFERFIASPVFHLVVEHITDGISTSDLLFEQYRLGGVSHFTRVFIEFSALLFTALEYAQTKYDFVHYDLKWDNVMCRIVDETYSYELETRPNYVVKCRPVKALIVTNVNQLRYIYVIPVIIDMGLSKGIFDIPGFGSGTGGGVESSIRYMPMTILGQSTRLNAQLTPYGVPGVDMSRWIWTGIPTVASRVMSNAIGNMYDGLNLVRILAGMFCYMYGVTGPIGKYLKDSGIYTGSTSSAIQHESIEGNAELTSFMRVFRRKIACSMTKPGQMDDMRLRRIIENSVRELPMKDVFGFFLNEGRIASVTPFTFIRMVHDLPNMNISLLDISKLNIRGDDSESVELMRKIVIIPSVPTISFMAKLRRLFEGNSVMRSSFTMMILIYEKVRKYTEMVMKAEEDGTKAVVINVDEANELLVRISDYILNYRTDLIENDRLFFKEEISKRPVGIPPAKISEAYLELIKHTVNTEVLGLLSYMIEWNGVYEYIYLVNFYFKLQSVLQLNYYDSMDVLDELRALVFGMSANSTLPDIKTSDKMCRMERYLRSLNLTHTVWSKLA